MCAVTTTSAGRSATPTPLRRAVTGRGTATSCPRSTAATSRCRLPRASRSASTSRPATSAPAEAPRPCAGSARRCAAATTAHWTWGSGDCWPCTASPSAGGRPHALHGRRGRACRRLHLSPRPRTCPRQPVAAAAVARRRRRGTAARSGQRRGPGVARHSSAGGRSDILSRAACRRQRAAAVGR